MTPDDIKRAEQLLAAATPGPWHNRADCEIWSEDGHLVADVLLRPPGDAQLIAAAPSLIRDLLDDNERLHQQIEHLIAQDDATINAAREVFAERDEARAEVERLRAALREVALLHRTDLATPWCPSCYAAPPCPTRQIVDRALAGNTDEQTSGGEAPIDMGYLSLPLGTQQAVEGLICPPVEPARSDACGRCGKTPAEGSASINNERFCHGDHPAGQPTCYMLSSWESTDGMYPDRIMRPVPSSGTDETPRTTGAILDDDALANACRALGICNAAYCGGEPCSQRDGDPAYWCRFCARLDPEAPCPAEAVPSGGAS